MRISYFGLRDLHDRAGERLRGAGAARLRARGRAVAQLAPLLDDQRAEVELIRGERHRLVLVGQVRGEFDRQRAAEAHLESEAVAAGPPYALRRCRQPGAALEPERPVRLVARRLVEHGRRVGQEVLVRRYAQLHAGRELGARLERSFARLHGVHEVGARARLHGGDRYPAPLGHAVPEPAGRQQEALAGAEREQAGRVVQALDHPADAEPAAERVAGALVEP